MELRQLRYFVALAEELHFGRAAERLHIVQPAVSQQLRRLEAELGARLIDRSTRRVALTAAGERFLPEARAVLAAAERAREAVAGSATLRLGTSTGLGERLPRLLAELARRAPERTVELVRVPMPARLRQVAAGTLDAALVRGAPAHPGVRLEPLWTDALVVALPAGHPAARAGTVALTDLRDLPVRLPPRAANPPLFDLVTAVCPFPLAPALNDQDMLAVIATGPPTWTVYYRAQAAALTAPGVRFLAPAPPLLMPTSLAVAADRVRPGVEALLGAGRAVATNTCSPAAPGG
jgi:DNA-binding transcriptional LysR family regulator